MNYNLENNNYMRKKKFYLNDITFFSLIWDVKLFVLLGLLLDVVVEVVDDDNFNEPNGFIILLPPPPTIDEVIPFV